MKRCPECRRDYYDDSLAYCLDDGAVLVDGPAEPPTAILEAGSRPDESPTRKFTDTSEQNGPPTKANRPPTAGIGRYVSVRSLAGLLVVAVFIAVGYLVYRRSRAGQDHISSIAVLPFENEGNDPGMSYLSDGVSESLIDKLSQVNGLKVIARTSSFKFRGPDVDVEDAANKLGAQAVITGKVAKVNDKLVLHVEMIDAKENRQVWSEQFSRGASDLLAIQQDVANAALDRIRGYIAGPAALQISRPTKNEQAYDLYLRARYVDQNAETPDETQKEIALLQQALTLDPNFAEAMGLLGNAYDDISDRDPGTYVPLSERTLDRADEIDPSLAEIHGYKGKLYRNQWRWSEADAEFKKALELNPNLAWVHNSYALFLTFVARPGDAVVEAKRAVELDPLVFGAGAGNGFVLMCAHHFDEAAENAKRVLSFNPNDVGAIAVLAWSADAQGSPADAVQIYQKVIQLSQGDPSAKTPMVYFLARSGDSAKAKAFLEEVRTAKPAPLPYDLAGIYAVMGDKDKAFEYLELAFQQRYKDMCYLRIDPSLEPLRSDSRFEDLVRRMNFPS